MNVKIISTLTVLIESANQGQTASIEPIYTDRPPAHTVFLPENPVPSISNTPPPKELAYDECQLYNWWTYQDTCEDGKSCGSGILTRSRLCNEADGWEFEEVPCSPCSRCEEGMEVVAWLDTPQIPDMDLRYQNQFAATIVKIMRNVIVIESEGIQVETEEFRYVKVDAHFKYEVPSAQVSLPNGQSCSISPQAPLPPETERTREEGVYCAEKMPANIDFNEMPMYVSEEDCFQECDDMVECKGCIWLCSLPGKYLWTTIEKCTKLPSTCNSFIAWKDKADIESPTEVKGRLITGRCGIDPEMSLPDVLWKTDLQLDHGLGVETCREICLADLSVYNMTLVAINAHSGLCECVTQCDRIYTDVHWKTMVFNESIPYFSFEKSTICHLPEKIEEIPIDYTIHDNTLYASPCEGCSPDCTFNADFDTVGPADGTCHQMKGCSRFGLEVHCDFNGAVILHENEETFTIMGCDASTFKKHPSAAF